MNIYLNLTQIANQIFSGNLAASYALIGAQNLEQVDKQLKTHGLDNDDTWKKIAGHSSFISPKRPDGDVFLHVPLKAEFAIEAASDMSVATAVAASVPEKYIEYWPQWELDSIPACEN